MPVWTLHQKCLRAPRGTSGRRRKQTLKALSRSPGAVSALEPTLDAPALQRAGAFFVEALAALPSASIRQTISIHIKKRSKLNGMKCHSAQFPLKRIATNVIARLSQHIHCLHPVRAFRAHEQRLQAGSQASPCSIVLDRKSVV